MNEDPLPSLRDLLLPRDLTPEEERRVAEWLARHPEAAPEWRTDLALSRGLRRLPPTPVPSNFTSLVLAEVRRQASANPAPLASSPTWLHALFFRYRIFGWGMAVIVGIAAIGWQLQLHQARRDAAYAQQVSPLRALANLSPNVLEDFDAIQRFDAEGSSVDFELLAALQ